MHDSPAYEDVHHVRRELGEQTLVVGDGDHRHGAFGCRLLYPAADGSESVDVEPGVDLVENGHGRPQDTELNHFVALLLAAGQVDVERPLEKCDVEADPTGLLLHQGQYVVSVVVASSGAQGSGEHVGGLHARNLGRILHAEEDAGLHPLPSGEVEKFTPVEDRRPTDVLVSGTAEQHVTERGLARPVGPHDGVDLAVGHHQVDTAQDLTARNGSLQVGDGKSHEREPSTAGSRVRNTSSPSISM